MSTETKWTDYGKKYLLNRKIVGVRYMTPEEQERLCWNSRAIVITLDDGTLLFPSRDDEGNDAGALFGIAAQGQEDLTFPVLY